MKRWSGSGALAVHMAEALMNPTIKPKVERAAYLCKADLVSEMVGEFPELQGIMGREYARLAGEPEPIYQAICEHYLPRFAGDGLPGTDVGAVVSIADKLDTIAGLFRHRPYPHRRRRSLCPAAAVSWHHQYHFAEEIYCLAGGPGGNSRGVACGKDHAITRGYYT